MSPMRCFKCQKFWHNYSTVSNMRRYGHSCQNFLLFVYSLRLSLSYIHSNFLFLFSLIFVLFSHLCSFFSLCIFVLLSCRSRRSHSRPPQLHLHSHSLPLSSSSRLKPISPRALKPLKPISPEAYLAADVSRLKPISLPMSPA